MKNEKDLSFEEIVQEVIFEIYGYPKDDEKPANAPFCTPEEVAEFRRAQNAGYGIIGKGLWIKSK